MAGGERSLRLGTRASALALAQAREVAAMIEVAQPDVTVTLVEVTTSGDRTAGPGDKRRWVAEIEQQLLDGQIDLAVHSAKDVPVELAAGLALVAAPPRADPRDALCGAASLGELREGARVGTSSLRRTSQLLALRDDLDVVELRGNVDTRLRKLDEGAGGVEAIVIALAGLERLGRTEEAGAALDAELIVPAPGQGTLALEARAGDDAIGAMADALSDYGAMTTLAAERALVAGLGADCYTPVGGYARLVEGGDLLLTAFVGLPDGSAWVRDVLEGPAGEPEALGAEVARRMLGAGAGELLERSRGSLA